MQGNHLFEYAVIRMVPHVEREEFLNIGIVLYCAHKNFSRQNLNWTKKGSRCFVKNWILKSSGNTLHLSNASAPEAKMRDPLEFYQCRNVFAGLPRHEAPSFRPRRSTRDCVTTRVRCWRGCLFSWFQRFNGNQVIGNHCLSAGGVHFVGGCSW